MCRKTKPVLQALAIGITVTVAGLAVGLKSLNKIQQLHNFKRKSAIGEDRIIYIDPVNDEADCLGSTKISLDDAEIGILDPFKFVQDHGDSEDIPQLEATGGLPGSAKLSQQESLDLVSIDYENDKEYGEEELPADKVSRLGKRPVEGFPAEFEEEEVFESLEEEFGIATPERSSKGDISAAIFAHESIAHLHEEGKNRGITIEVASQDEKELAVPPVEEKISGKPKKPRKKPVKVVELEWTDFAEFKEKYGSLVTEAFEASRADEKFVLKVTGKSHGIGARGTVKEDKNGRQVKSFNTQDIQKIYQKLNTSK